MHDTTSVDTSHSAVAEPRPQWSTLHVLAAYLGATILLLLSLGILALGWSLLNPNYESRTQASGDLLLCSGLILMVASVLLYARKGWAALVLGALSLIVFLLDVVANL